MSGVRPGHVPKIRPVSEWLAEAVALAERNVEEGGRPFGALVVLDGAVVATGVNRAEQDHDPTAHAELMAIRAACAALGSDRLPGALLVSSCEPCPMCQAAAFLAGVERVDFAATSEDATRAGFDISGLADQFTRPFPERPVALHHVETAGAGRPFDLWRSRPS
jgi:guanine deaminase